MSFVPSRGNMDFDEWLKEKEAWEAKYQKYQKTLIWIEDALKLPGETGGEWLNTFEGLSQNDQDELLDQARKEMAI